MQIDYYAKQEWKGNFFVARHGRNIKMTAIHMNCNTAENYNERDSYV